MTDEQEQQLRGVIAARLKWMTGDRLVSTAKAAGINVSGVLSHLAHQHSEDAGRPMPANTDRANVAAWGASQRKEADQ